VARSAYPGGVLRASTSTKGGTCLVFCLPNTLPPAGLFTAAHGLLLLLTVLSLVLGLRLTRHFGEQRLRRVFLMLTVLLLLLETGKILFALLRVGTRNPNEFVPLYFCSITLAAGLFSGAGRGRLRLCGDIFLATGGLVGGIVFLLIPATSLPHYPAWHFLSLYSFLLHGAMVYMGLSLHLNGLYRIRREDLALAALPISLTAAAALLFNRIYDLVTGTEIANLMFLSRDFPGTPISLLYRLPRPLFTLLMWVTQALGPFLLVLLVTRLVGGRRAAQVPENGGEKRVF